MKATATRTKKKQSEKELIEHIQESILTPEQYEALTKANYTHPKSRMVLRLFLHLSFFWHVCRYMQGKSDVIAGISWSEMERHARQLIDKVLADLLQGIDQDDWNQIYEQSKAASRPKTMTLVKPKAK